MATARRSAPYRLLLIWLAFGLLLALLALAYVVTIRRAAQLDVQRRQWHSIDWRVHRGLWGHHGENVQELAKHFNKGRPFDRRGTLTAGGWVEVEANAIIDCDPGWLVRLQLSQSGLYSARVVSPSKPSDELPALMVGYADRTRQIVAALSLVLWLAAMTLLPGCGQWTRVVAQWCVGAALLCALMCGLPFYIAGAWPRTHWDEAQLGGLLFLLVLPFLLLTTRKTPSKSGCKRCGYNLTGNTSGICPECGTTTPGSHRGLRSQSAERYAQLLERLESAR